MHIVVVGAGEYDAGWTAPLRHPPAMGQFGPGAIPAAFGRGHPLRMDWPPWSGLHSMAYPRIPGTVPPYTARGRVDKSVSCVVRVPLIKPGRRNDTPPSLQARAEGRLILRRLSPGIDDDAFAIKIGETPTKQISQPPSFPV